MKVKFLIPTQQEVIVPFCEQRGLLVTVPSGAPPR